MESIITSDPNQSLSLRGQVPLIYRQGKYPGRGKMSIVYRYGTNLYINLTNKCPCSCIFCVRDTTPKLGDADSLWLKEEPTSDQIMEALRACDLDSAGQIVFCGYGEPTERLEVLKETARRIRSELRKTIRVDTNGLGNLINGRDIVPELAEVIDSISISLNAPDAESYKKMTRCVFDAEEAYTSLMSFIRECKERIGGVTVSIVGGYQPAEDEEKCRRIAEDLGVRFRVR